MTLISPISLLKQGLSMTFDTSRYFSMVETPMPRLKMYPGNQVSMTPVSLSRKRPPLVEEKTFPYPRYVFGYRAPPSSPAVAVAMPGLERYHFIAMMRKG